MVIEVKSAYKPASQAIITIGDSLDRGRSVSIGDAFILWQEASDEDLGWLSTKVKNRFHEPNAATYLIMRVINYTNICVAKCDYCAFYRSPRSPDGYVLPIESIYSKIDELLNIGGSHVCFNGGFNPKLTIDFYLDLFSSVRGRYGDKIEFYAMTVPELIYVCRLSRLEIADGIKLLKQAGVRWITGGGAEILSNTFRKRHSPLKYSVEEFLQAQREILQSGLNTTATMVIGFDETIEERLEHLQSVRQFQDMAKRELPGELFSFLCWTYKPGNTALGGKEISPKEYLRHMAIARIYLNNIKHIRTSVLTQNANALKALHYGADDFDLPWEDEVTQTAGSTIEQDVERICGYAKSEGFTPRIRESLISHHDR